MKNLRDLTEEREGLVNESKALVALAEKEDRDFTPDEQSHFDDIANNLLPAVDERIENRKKFDDMVKQQAAISLGSQLPDPEGRQIGTDGASLGLPASRDTIKVPAKAKRGGHLKAFKGPDAERNAFVAGQIYLAGALGKESSIQWCKDHGIVYNAMTEGTNSAGGFAVDDEMMAAILRLREERGVFFRYANQVPMGSDVMTIPRLITDVTAAWTNEATAVSASDATLAQATLTAKKLLVLTKISTELDEDAIVSIGDAVTQSMAYQTADKVDDAGFNGDGTSGFGSITGLANALNSAAINTLGTGDTALSNVVLKDYEETMALVGQYPGANYRWYVHSTTYYNSMLNLLNAAGGNTIASLAAGQTEPMFLGYPVTFAQVMDSSLAASDDVCYFGDLGLAASVGTRSAFNTAVSAERYFEEDVIALRSRERIAVTVHETGDTIRTRPIVAMRLAAA